MDLGYERVTVLTARVVYRAHKDDDAHAVMQEALSKALGPDVILTCESTTAKLDTWLGWAEGPNPPRPLTDA